MFTKWFISKLRSRDSFGHEFNLSYKGNESHNSVCGGIVTLMVQALTMVLVYSAVKELILMEDPTIQSFTIPLSD